MQTRVAGSTHLDVPFLISGSLLVVSTDLLVALIEVSVEAFVKFLGVHLSVVPLEVLGVVLVVGVFTAKRTYETKDTFVHAIRKGHQCQSLVAFSSRGFSGRWFYSATNLVPITASTKREVSAMNEKGA